MKETRVHGTRVILRQPGRIANWLAARRERFDLLLTIDYNLGYSVYLRSLPRTPAIIWVRDPRSPDDARRINTVRIPGQPDETPQGLYSFDSRSIARIHSESQWLGRPLLFATPALHLVGRLEGAYGIEPEHVFIPPERRPAQPATQSSRASGRRSCFWRGSIRTSGHGCSPSSPDRFPTSSSGSSDNRISPAPVPGSPITCRRTCACAATSTKTRRRGCCRRRGLPINTSVHEGMPVSFLEALACETPFLSGIDPGYAIAKFGIITGRTDGDGMQGLEAFRHGLERLLGDERLRRGLGQQGRAWVRAVHNREHFLECFDRLCEKAGVAR